MAYSIHIFCISETTKRSFAKPTGIPATVAFEAPNLPPSLRGSKNMPQLLPLRFALGPKGLVRFRPDPVRPGLPDSGSGLEENGRG